MPFVDTHLHLEEVDDADGAVSEAVEAGVTRMITVGTDLPRSIHDLMDFYPQTSQRRPGVEFIPIPYPQRPTEPAKTER